MSLQEREGRACVLQKSQKTWISGYEGRGCEYAGFGIEVELEKV